MRRFATIFILFIAAIIMTSTGGVAQNKFENKDTAKDRQDARWGTRNGKSTIVIDKNERGDTVINSIPDKTETDDADKYPVIINVDTDYNPHSNGTSGTTSNNSSWSNSTGGGNQTNQGSSSSTVTW